MFGQIEIDDVKKLRKSLLVTSVGTITLSQIIDNSEPDSKFNFLGLEIPLAESDFLLKLLGIMLIFFIIALLIRFANEEFIKHYKRKFTEISEIHKAFDWRDDEASERRKLKSKVKSKKKYLDLFIIFLDILFPIILGFISVIYAFK